MTKIFFNHDSCCET